MTNQYTHLTPEERAAVMLALAQGDSLRAIARHLGRHPSTISREIRRNCCASSTDQPTPSYSASAAGRAYSVRRSRSRRSTRLVRGTPLFSKVYNRLVHWRWSPQQIAARLRLMHPADPTQWISHEAIYAAIYAYPRGALKQGMLQALRQRKAKRGVSRTTLASGHRIPEELRIVHRPEEVQQRLVPGHWEGDFIKGSFNRSAVGTVVERKTRYVVLCRMDGCTSENALEGFCRQMKTLPAQLRQSFTYDRGSELACFEELSRRLSMDIWFADPYAPWQRGSNENTNGLLRQFLPKGTDLSTVSQTRLNDIARLMNDRPRETLGWRTPAEALAEEMEAFAQTVALAS